MRKRHVSWFIKEFLKDTVFHGIWYAFASAKAWGVVIGAVVAAISKALVSINWPLVTLIFLVGSAIFIVSIDTFMQWCGKSKLKVVFCDKNGRPAKKPEAKFWVVGTNNISYLVQGYFMLENLSKMDTSLKSGYVSVVAKRKELNINHHLPQFPVNVSIRHGGHTAPMLLHSQNMVDEYVLRALVGTDYGEANLVLTIEAVGLRPSRTKFNKVYSTPS